MSNWLTCYRCKYWFLPDNDKQNYKVVQYKDKIIGVTCPDCSHYMGQEKEEKTA